MKKSFPILMIAVCFIFSLCFPSEAPAPGLCYGVVCDDLDPCTDDYCDPYTGLCVYIPNNTCDGGEACTPGYWKNLKKPDRLVKWSEAGYDPANDFDTTFGVDLFDPDISLGLAIKMGGGGVKKLARHGTAALLSAAHPGVNYPLSVAEVIAAVQAGDADTLADYNEDLNCPF